MATVTTLQTQIHSLYAGDDSTPDSSAAEWTVRLNYIVAAIHAWDSEMGMQWNELWTTLADAGSGDSTIVADTLAYDAPSDFRFLGGYVETYTTSDQRTKWKIITPQEAAVHQGAGVTGLDDGYVYVTGNTKTGFKINFSSQPTAGDTIAYPYYKEPFEPTSGSHEVEMSDPYFCVYYALAKLHEHDGEGDRATFAMSQAETKLNAMKTRNALLPHYQLNTAQDSTVLRTYAGFGT